MSIKNIRRDSAANSVEAALAGEILASYMDFHDEVPEGTRVIVIVATGIERGRVGCSYEGYDESGGDELLMRDLAMLARGVDLGGNS